jgi:tRNA-2-methylthio-N6-dimethylallyladenosine synthase
MAYLIHKPEIKLARKRSSSLTNTTRFVMDERFSDLGRDRSYLIQTHGCQANESDSERIAGLLVAMGFSPAKSVETADLIIINTCAVRENAEAKVFGEIGRLKQFKESNPNMILAIAGCMPQEEVVVEKILKTYRHVDIVFGTHNLHQLPQYLDLVIREKRQLIDVFSEEGDIVENVPAVRANRFKAWVNIMYGCDEFCTYCIVPYTRGKERSRHADDIVSEIKGLIADGYQEVTLLGQNVNAYGLDLPDGSITFADLLETLSLLPIPRIRFTTSHPKDFSPRLIEVLSRGKNLMPYIHLPVQSGSNRILTAMNRKYTRESYLDLVHALREQIPGVSLTTDIIVGFPGETETDFCETLSLVEAADFEGAYTFIYSKRSGTPAANYTDDVLPSIKKERLHRLNQIVNAGYLKGNQRFANQVVEVLVEGVSKTDPHRLAGYTPHNKIVNFTGPIDAIGSLVWVRITHVNTWSLLGEMVAFKN